MNTYSITRVNASGVVPMDSPLWQHAGEAVIGNFAWDEGKGYRPNTTARLLAGENGISVLFTTDEFPLRCTCSQYNTRVCCDSCVEFFLRPESDDRYLNFEMNCAGMMMIGLGGGRANRQLLSFDAARFCLADRISGRSWQHLLYIPFDFLKEVYGSWDGDFLGNLYKCGDETVHPHYASWNPVGTANPDFHRPEYFGKFIVDRT